MTDEQVDALIREAIKRCNEVGTDAAFLGTWRAIFHAGAAWQREQDARIAESLSINRYSREAVLDIAAAIRRAGEA